MKTTSLENGFITFPHNSQRGGDDFLSAYAALRDSTLEALKDTSDCSAVAAKLLKAAQDIDLDEENAIRNLPFELRLTPW